jgi:WD40 repeat protein
LWDVATGILIRTVRLPEEVAKVALSPDGKALASTMAADEAPIRLWDLVTGKEIRRFAGDEGRAVRVAFSPDGKTLAAVEMDGTVSFWDVATAKELRRLHFPYDHWATTWGAAFSPDGKRLALGEPIGTVQLWDAATGKDLRPAPGHGHTVSHIRFARDGKTVVTAGVDDMACSWDPATGKQLRQLARPRAFTFPFALFPDGRTVGAWGTDSRIRLWDLATGQTLRGFDPSQDEITPLALSGDGKTLAVWGEVLRLWDVGTGKELRRFSGRNSERKWVYAFRLSEDGKVLAYEEEEGKIILVDTATGNEIRRLDARLDARRRRGERRWWHTGGFVVSLAFSPDGKFLATGLHLQTASVWELATGKEVGWAVEHPYTYKLDQQTDSTIQPFCMAFSPDGATLAAGGQDKSVRLWDVATAREVARFTGHEGSIRSLAFSPDGKLLASGSRDTTGLVWDVAALLRQRRPPEANLSPQELRQSWAALAGEDAAKAFAARWKLVAAARESVPFLQERLRPVAGAGPQRIQALIGDLNSDRFDVREKATAELERVGELAEPALSEVVRSGPSAEVRQRARRLLETLGRGRLQLSPEQLQALRAVEVLEHVGTPEAQQVLKTLSLGVPEARLTQEAKASLRRLAR